MSLRVSVPVPDSCLPVAFAVCFCAVGALSTGCGGPDSAYSVSEQEREAAVAQPEGGAELTGGLDGGEGSESSEFQPTGGAEVGAPVQGPDPSTEASESIESGESLVQNRCATPRGVSGAPSTIDELIQLINALPKPVTLPCFLESLQRPLDVFLTRSGQSGQPAVGASNPRVFVFYGRLSFTIVPGGGGESSELLEFAFRTTDEEVDRELAQFRDVTLQAVRGEVGFPVYRPITDTVLAERIAGGLGTLCGGCHLGEKPTAPEDGYFEGAFASNVMAPFPPYDVELGSLRQEANRCDHDAEPERCEVLSALFDHGEVRAYDFR